MKDIKNRTALSQNLIKLRKKYGLTQKELALKSGVSRRTIALYETNPSKPPFENIKKLASALSVTVEDLVGSENESLKGSALDRVFTNVDSRTLKKIKLILSLTPEQRHMVYAFVDSLLNRNTSKEKKAS
jgi:transcriptional regulator with XRE-family HTH domain